jgi:hypothetical protein
MMTPWAPAPGLTLGDCLRRGEDGHCADCLPGYTCPDHREDLTADPGVPAWERRREYLHEMKD